MDNQALIAQLRQELKDNGDEERAVKAKKFFKEEIRPYGLENAAASELNRRFYKVIADKSKQNVFALCEELFASGMYEEGIIAGKWSYETVKQLQPGDFVVFERWVDKYVSNWACCDTLCNHTVGDFIMMYPQHIEGLKKWAESDNRWMKRAAAVTLIIPARKGLFLDDIFEIADKLLADTDDLVQKGYGWMLKAASERYPQEVFEYVMSKKNVMPRTAFRYALEKMPKEMRAEAMKK